MEQDIRYLIDTLNKATESYDRGNPIMSDKEWDDIYFMIEDFEKKTGIIYPDSPTQSISYQVVNNLIKREHSHQMLSLEKTKSIEEVAQFFKNKNFVAMCKMDGLTCSLTYKNGELISAETRGNGIIGEDILHNAKIIPSIPKKIPYSPGMPEIITIDGEIICDYNTFEKFNKDYRHPRNFAAGSIRLLDSKECFSRGLSFVAWELIESIYDENQIEYSLHDKLHYLNEIGFLVVPWITAIDLDSDIDVESIQEIIDDLINKAKKFYYPIDGVVFKFNDCEYGRSLGQTAHHFKNAIAYKFYDETYETKMINIEWTIGRTGILTPIAVFSPVEIDGCIIERASLHNLTILKETLHSSGWVGQNIEVYKSNMIIPQIYSAEEDNELTKDYFDYPHVCPICGGPTAIKQENESMFVICDNPNCEGKLINKLDHFCGKKGLDIKGLSKATLNKLIDWGWVNSFSDIFELYKYRSEWISKCGFGQKSVDNILQSIEDKKIQYLENFISAIGIPLIGINMAKELIKYISSYEDFRNKIQNGFDFTIIEGFAGAKNDAICNFNYDEADAVAKYITFLKNEPLLNKANNNLNGLTFVITGRLSKYQNRNELQNDIVANSGKVVSSISKNVNYLINNDINSTSSKNLSAKKLNIPIISEEEFLEKILKKF